MGFLRLTRKTVIPNSNRVTVNVPPSCWLNLAKGSAPLIDPNNASPDGYPKTTPASSWIFQSARPPAGYFGSYVWKWTGQGSMQIAGTAILVSAGGGGGYQGLAYPQGDLSTNVTIVSQADPNVTFQFGYLIQSIGPGASNGAGGNLIRIAVKTNFLNNGMAAGDHGHHRGQRQHHRSEHRLEPAVKTTIAVDPSHFDLQGSTYTNAQAGAAGSAVYAPVQIAFYFSAGGTYGTGATQMKDLVFCRAADESAITAGQYMDNVLIGQLQYLMNSAGQSDKGWLRFMDQSAVQGGFECDFSQRTPVTYVSWSATRWCDGYWINNIANASDALTCSNPSNSGSGAYVDGEVVQGNISAANTTRNPTLAITGRAGGAKFYL